MKAGPRLASGGRRKPKLAAERRRKPWLCSVPDFPAMTNGTMNMMAEGAWLRWPCAGGSMRELGHISVEQEVETGQKGWTVTSRPALPRDSSLARLHF